jgi:AcrR family transcriptional regulator
VIASLHLPVPVEERPLRRDAERNRRRILEAARELFAECGLGVTLNDVAHHAGVGGGTVYRRFPDKAQLIDALFKERIEEFAELMNSALDDPDPWPAFVRFLEQSLELQAKRGWISTRLSKRPMARQARSKRLSPHTSRA